MYAYQITSISFSGSTHIMCVSIRLAVLLSAMIWHEIESIVYLKRQLTVPSPWLKKALGLGSVFLAITLHCSEKAIHLHSGAFQDDSFAHTPFEGRCFWRLFLSSDQTCVLNLELMAQIGYLKEYKRDEQALLSLHNTVCIIELDSTLWTISDSLWHWSCHCHYYPTC